MTDKRSTSGRHKSPNRLSAFHIITWIWALVTLIVVAAILFAPRKPPAPPPSEMSYQPPPTSVDRLPRRDPFIETASMEAPRATGPRQKPAERFAIYGYVTEAAAGESVTHARLACKLIQSEEHKRTFSELRERMETTRSSADLDKFLEFERKFRSFAADHTTTDRDGAYEMRVPEPGEYLVTVHATGYRPAEDVQALVTEESPEMRADFEMSRGASISGRVSETGGAGAPGIPIYVHSDTARRDGATTNEDGEYTITGLEPGTYNVSLDLSRTPFEVSGRIPEQEVTIGGEDEQVTGIDFVVEAAGVVWGFVLDPSRQPVRNAGVMLCTSESIISQAIDAVMKTIETGGDRAPVLGDKTDGDGYYELFGVPLNKEWRLIANAQTFAPQLSNSFLLTSGMRSMHVDVFVVPGTTVYGRVVSTDRSPVAGADVWCIPSYTKFFAPMDAPVAPFKDDRSGEDGTFEIEDLPPGDYQLLAHHADFKSSAAGEPVQPTGYSDIYNIEIVLKPIDMGEYSVFGTVTDAAGSPIEGAGLALASMSGGNLGGAGRETSTGIDGYYEFAGVEPGFLMLHAGKEGYSAQTISKVMLDEPTDIVLEESSGVSGRVLVRDTGRAPEYYSVQAIPVMGDDRQNLSFFEMAEGLNSRGFRNEDGSFDLELPPGRYTLEGRAKGYTPGKVDVNLAAGQRLDGVTIYVSRAGGRIRGRVATRDGRSPQGANVWVMEQGRSFGPFMGLAQESGRRAVTVGSDGLFEFENLAAGTYNLMARHPRYAQAKSGPIELGEGQTVGNVLVTLGFGGSLQGYVAVNGKLTPGAIVTLVGNNVNKMVTADRNAQYRIDEIPVGSYMASAISVRDGGFADMFAPLHARVEIVEGRTTIHNFGEETGATIVGVCSPPPTFGTTGFAVVRIPGAPGGMSGMNLANPMSWFTGDSANANYVVGMSQFSTDGYFKIDNIPPGSFLLEIFYMNLVEVLSGGGRPRYSTSINITGTELIEVDIKVADE